MSNRSTRIAHNRRGLGLQLSIHQRTTRLRRGGALLLVQHTRQRGQSLQHDTSLEAHFLNIRLGTFVAVAHRVVFGFDLVEPFLELDAFLLVRELDAGRIGVVIEAAAVAAAVADGCG
jgi:hypothetical protein